MLLAVDLYHTRSNVTSASIPTFSGDQLIADFLPLYAHVIVERVVAKATHARDQIREATSRATLLPVDSA